MALPTEALASFPSHQCPPFKEIQDLAGKYRLNATNEGFVLLIRQPNRPPTPYGRRDARLVFLGDDPVRIYVSTLMRGSCKPVASLLPARANTFRMLKRFYW